MEQGRPFSATERPSVDFDALCQKVRAAVEPARAHAISLHDEHGDVLWLSEDSMGPDEHNAVREAIDAFGKNGSPPVLVYDLGDSRSAVLLRAVNGRRALVGAVMMIMETRAIPQGDRGALRLMTPNLQRALMEFAGMRPASDPATSSSAPFELALLDSGRVPVIKPPLPEAKQPVPAAKRPMPVAKPAPPKAARNPLDAAGAGAPAGSRTAQDQREPAVTPEVDRLHAALRRSPIALHVQRLVPLTKGSQLKRYEVLLRSKSEDAPNAAPAAMLKAAVEHGLGSMIDRRVVTELIGWLVHHPDVWQTHAVMFSVNLTTTALHDEHFIKFVELCLAKSSLPKAMIGFEVDVPTAVKLARRVAEVAAALHRLGCPLVLDDFAMRTECFELLRLPGVRYVKIAPAITQNMRTDKLAQASITAVVQMARVLGMYTVAKRTDTQAEQEWLTALGVDFIQSNAMSPPAAIDSLSKGQKSRH
ncbi:MAG: EAL domain-containing protein [Steroidobacteraceae bacterium]